MQGCIELLERTGIQIAGKRAVVVGRSNIVGTPAAQLLQRRDATVTVVHSRTPDGAAICREADIVVAACGRAEMLTGDWITPGAVVIDVGINAVDVSSAESLSRGSHAEAQPEGLGDTASCTCAAAQPAQQLLHPDPDS